ncbi:MAG: LD-carboxypeptidase [Syntrophobacter sp.]
MILEKPGHGEAIALIAPASPFDAALYEKGRSILENAGFRTVPGRSIFSRENYLAGSDLQRARDLTDALLDPEIKAVICIRGGYGSGRLLPWLPFPSLRRKPKIFIGHSDITFLHMTFISQMGWTTLLGPNVTGLAGAQEQAEAVLRVLSGTDGFQWKLDPSQVLRHGRRTGPVLGGNLTCISHMIGTPYLPDMTGALLLIEDRGEALYRLDRMINHLKLSGILPGLGGLLLGEFDDCAENDRITEMVMEHVRFFDFPVIHSLPFGHGRRNGVIPLGAPFLLDTHEHVLGIIESPIGA